MTVTVMKKLTLVSHLQKKSWIRPMFSLDTAATRETRTNLFTSSFNLMSMALT